MFASNPAPETVFGISCVTKNSYVLRVVHRGCLTNKLTWSRGPADFVQHGQLALLKQAFPNFFEGLPTGLHTNTRAVPSVRTTLFVPIAMTIGSSWSGIKTKHFGKKHWFCFLLFGALTCEEFMFAHPIKNPDGIDNFTDAPCCLGGGGVYGKPWPQVTYNQVYRHYDANLARLGSPCCW
jgi:hypothetical protein